MTDYRHDPVLRLGRSFAKGYRLKVDGRGRAVHEVALACPCRATVGYVVRSREVRADDDRLLVYVKRQRPADWHAQRRALTGGLDEAELDIGGQTATVRFDGLPTMTHGRRFDSGVTVWRLLRPTMPVDYPGAWCRRCAVELVVDLAEVQTAADTHGRILVLHIAESHR